MSCWFFLSVWLIGLEIDDIEILLILDGLFLYDYIFTRWFINDLALFSSVICWSLLSSYYLLNVWSIGLNRHSLLLICSCVTCSTLFIDFPNGFFVRLPFSYRCIYVFQAFRFCSLWSKIIFKFHLINIKQIITNQ